MLDGIREVVTSGRIGDAAEIVNTALVEGLSPEDILNGALIPAMDIVGEEYEAGDRYVPEMLVSAETMKAAMAVLKPRLLSAGVQSRGRVVIGTVEGDLHDIGKNLVAVLLEGAGFEVIDVGTEVAADQFVQAVEEHRPQLLGLSALLTTTMLRMPEVIGALEAAALRDRVKVMIGGAPVTQDYADQIGADGYAPDAPSAVELARRLLGGCGT